jgi:hypothetical protein
MTVEVIVSAAVARPVVLSIRLEAGWDRHDDDGDPFKKKRETEFFRSRHATSKLTAREAKARHHGRSNDRGI